MFHTTAICFCFFECVHVCFCVCSEIFVPCAYSLFVYLGRHTIHMMMVHLISITDISMVFQDGLLIGQSSHLNAVSMCIYQCV